MPVTPGPAKSFDQNEALEIARNVFWRRGYEGTAISELESALGIGRKSLYDTFGSKRELYLRAIEHYSNSVVQKICNGLEDPNGSPLQNLQRTLNSLQKRHATPGSLGCMLGVAMAQVDPADRELTKILRSYLGKLELAFEKTIRSGQADGTVQSQSKAKDLARNLVAVAQGVALIGRITETAGMPAAIVRAAMHGLKA